jgi:hypothetical protein
VVKRVERADEVASNGAAKAAILKDDHGVGTAREKLVVETTSPNSLTTTTVFASSSERSAALIRVVFPLPRNPVTRVTGIRLLVAASELLTGIEVLG